MIFIKGGEWRIIPLAGRFDWPHDANGNQAKTVKSYCSMFTQLALLPAVQVLFFGH